MRCRSIFLLGVFLAVFMTSCGRKPVRIVFDFNKDWEFSLAADVEDSLVWQQVDLPHDWSIEGPFDKDHPATPSGGALPGGKGTYRKVFATESKTKGKRIFLEFDGVYRESRVFVNGHRVGYRPCGYASFSYDITPFLNETGESNVVEVTADNARQPNSRWYSGSGIYRNVRMVATSGVYIPYSGTYITTPRVTEEQAVVSVRTKVAVDSWDGTYVYLLTKVKNNRGKTVARECTFIDLKDTLQVEVEQILTVKNPERWDVDDPVMYTAESKLIRKGNVLDNYTTSFGIRTFSFSSKEGFFLNGRSLKLLGVCMHHDLGSLGAAVNIRAMERQLELLKDMGCNAVRTAHNPPAPEWLDLCDKMGFLVINEAFDVWRQKKSEYDYSLFFDEWYKKDLEDFIVRDRNHPSVIVWSIGNEVKEQWDDSPSDVLLTRNLVEIVKELDPTRPVTAGCDEPGVHNNLFKANALDIIGFNYRSWAYEKVPEHFPDMPFVATETTSSVHTRGFYQMPSDSIRIEPREWWMSYETSHYACSAYDNMHVPWGNTHEDAWIQVRDNPFISGMFVWTGFDYLGEPTPYSWPARSSYFGIIDLAGFPKDVYYLYQSEWTDTPMLHVFPHWNWEPGQQVDVWAYYNQADSVELFLNEKSLGVGKKTPERLHAFWRVAYEPGKLTAISYKNGQQVLTRTVSTAGQAAQLRLTADRPVLQADGKDLAFVTVEVLDEHGVLVPYADDLISFSIEGPGIIKAVDNGNPTSHESFVAQERKAFYGKCLVVVQTEQQPGDIILTAASQTFSKKVSLSLKSRFVQ